MKRKHRIFLSAIVLAMLIPMPAFAGNPDSAAAPGSTSSYTLENIYNRLKDDTVPAGQSVFAEPGAGPVKGTGHTLNEMMRGIENRVPAKTGQTTSYSAKDDGDLERGVPLPAPRFTDNGDGTVTDNLTRLIWLKNANCATVSPKTWATALTSVAGLADGSCGLSDSSAAGDWRLPNVRELYSLIDLSKYNPALPAGHPFTGVQSNYYWTGTTYSGSTSNAWNVGLNGGDVSYGGKTNTLYVWPVRGGQ